MARSAEEVMLREGVAESEAIRDSAMERLRDYSRKTNIYFLPDWDAWCVLLREELGKRTDALIDEQDPQEKARLQGICWSLRWVLKQKEVAEGNIRALRSEMDGQETL